jgi:ornithine carbamoyltransferase
MARHFLSILDFSHGELEHCLDLASAMKRDRHLGRRAPSATALDGRHVALLFEKPSLRTRSTFEVAVHELGGYVLSPPSDVALGGREDLRDVARNLERWVAAAVIRTFSQQRLVTVAETAPSLVVINALSDEEHPCQALADFLTLKEHWGRLEGETLAFIGDGNNVAASLAHAGLMLGVSVHIASPEGYELPSRVVQEATAASRHRARVRLFRDPRDAVREARAVYTDVWASMGQEAEAAERGALFRPYQVNAELMAAAAANAVFLHCLPAHRGDEVTDEVIDASYSLVFDEAENRLHTQKALLFMLLGEGGSC